MTFSASLEIRETYGAKLEQCLKHYKNFAYKDNLVEYYNLQIITMYYQKRLKIGLMYMSFPATDLKSINMQLSWFSGTGDIFWQNIYIDALKIVRVPKSGLC